MLVELLRPAGMELARRWLAALLCVPSSEREQVVAAIEARIARTYLAGRLPSHAAQAEAERIERDERAGEDEQTMRVAYPPMQKDGYVEQEFREYAVEKDEAKPAPKRKKQSKRKGA